MWLVQLKTKLLTKSQWGILKMKRLLGRLRRSWENNMKMNPKETLCCVTDWSFVAQGMAKHWDIFNAEVNVWVL